MCGIFGTRGALAYSSENINTWLGHRGPDEQSNTAIDGGFFHHVRLSIVDLTHGKQPMENDRYCMIWNGEIYNHLDLRALWDLKCDTHSDTETLFVALQNRGIDALSAMDGMFAIAWLDKHTGEITLLRDRAGKKPLYYFLDGENFAFSSELLCLAKHVKPRMQTEHVANFFQVGYFFGQETPYENIRAVQSAGVIRVDASNVLQENKRWWNYDGLFQQEKLSEQEVLPALDKALHSTIKRRLLSSDLEVGSFLSGGIDSGLVTAIASQYTDALKTYTVSFRGTFDEAPLAKTVADHCNTTHHEIQINFDSLEEDIEQILRSYGQPFMDSSAIPSYYVAKAAKEHVSVVLNGDGADELFGGYRRFVPFASIDFFSLSTPLRSVFGGLARILPEKAGHRSILNFAKRFASLGSRQGLELYFASTYDLYTGFESDAFLKSPTHGEFSQVLDNILNNSSSGLEKMLKLDMHGPLFGDLLVKMDIATMQHSVEGRSPLLGKEVLELSPRIPDNYKVKGKTTKFALRELSRKYLPEPLVGQPKRGFEIPLVSWVDNALKAPIGDYLHAQNAGYKEFISPSFVENLWNKSLDISEHRRAKILYQLFAFEVWNTQRIH